MKKIGVILIASAVIAVAAMQISGHGLVTTRASTTPPQVTPGPSGTTLRVTSGPDTLIHIKRVVLIVGVAGLGLLCLLKPGREKHHA
jgi:hypothetical protein